MPVFKVDFRFWGNITTIQDYGLVSRQVSDSMSSQLKWNSSELDWFAYVDNTTLESESVRCVVWVLSRNELNKTVGLNESTILEHAKRQLIDSFDAGLLKINIAVDSQSFVATNLSACADLECLNKTHTYSHLYNLSSTSSEKQLIASVSFLIAFCVVALIGKVNF